MTSTWTGVCKENICCCLLFIYRIWVVNRPGEVVGEFYPLKMSQTLFFFKLLLKRNQVSNDWRSKPTACTFPAADMTNFYTVFQFRHFLVHSYQTRLLLCSILPWCRYIVRHSNSSHWSRGGHLLWQGVWSSSHTDHTLLWQGLPVLGALGWAHSDAGHPACQWAP